MGMTRSVALPCVAIIVVVVSLLLLGGNREAHLLGSLHSSPSIIGRWGPRIQTPLIATGAAVLPRSGNVLLWAADGLAVFDEYTDNANYTITAIYDRSQGTVTMRNVTNTRHNMFCPGVSLDGDGRPIVTGGKSSRRTSTFNETISEWMNGPEMHVGRGYHAQATLSDGGIFSIGGSWSGGLGGKHGEVLEAGGAWRDLPQCISEAMLTDDEGGIFASDNHPWLFAWKNATVFQAGPSKAMNWYGTIENGSHTSAGLRGIDGDAMCGNAVMYDAVAGKLLTIGGSPSYRASPSTRAAHVITLGMPFEDVSVEQMEDMLYPRAYANSVILPSGHVFVNGGQSWARQWTDANSSIVSELWDPETQKFQSLGPAPVPRNYHSIAVLLPDASVLVGGGGLCWGGCEDESANHFDLQIYYPPYWFRYSNDSLRPGIKWISKTKMSPGSVFEVTTSDNVASFALVRYGSSTHTVNTDQRRVVLKFEHVRGDQSRFRLHLPRDPGVLIPGFWMLFALDSQRVPSVSRTVWILSS